MEKPTKDALLAKDNPYKRNSFIQENKEFIRKHSSNVCKRNLDWSNDDELSIALMAFNEAIDKFNKESNYSFLAFAKIVIQRRLIDHFRKESKHINLSLDNNKKEKEIKDFINYETSESIKDYKIKEDKKDLAFEIELYKKILKDYDLTIEDLTSNSPTHKNTRNNLMDLAYTISKEKQLVSKILDNGRIPIKYICDIYGTKKRFLERWRKYLIALILVLTHKDLVNFKYYIFSERGFFK